MFFIITGMAVLPAMNIRSTAPLAERAGMSKGIRKVEVIMVASLITVASGTYHFSNPVHTRAIPAQGAGPMKIKPNPGSA
ncbi:MAG: hypothetical protein JXA35_01505 [Deltaproteobacteria bacterium]|nr:hypothetical protein [Deltaproteobacteria bacterium]